jgi:hypothetical protein
VSRETLFKPTARSNNSLSILCCWLLFVTVRFNREPDVSFSHSKTLSQIETSHGSFYRLRIKFLSINKGTLLPNFQKLLPVGLLVQDFRDWKESSVFTCTKFHSSQNLVGWEG